MSFFAEVILLSLAKHLHIAFQSEYNYIKKGMRVAVPLGKVKSIRR
jgi:hypothetical protein